MEVTNTVIREYFGESAAIAVATKLIRRSAPFTVEPLPCNVFELTAKAEYERILPAENVGRDALFEAGRGLECRYCGRHYRAGDLFEGDPCPSDGCPSHELKELQ